MPLYRAAELRLMLDKARVSLAFAIGGSAKSWNRPARDWTALRPRISRADPDGFEARMASQPGEFSTVDTAAEDVAIIAFTSGTTGTPKAAMHFHRDLLATCDTYGARVLQPQRAIFFAAARRWHSRSALAALLFPFSVGAATLLLEKAGPEELLRASPSTARLPCLRHR